MMLTALVLVLATTPPPARLQVTPPRPQVTGATGPRVEVAFVLDTTGSMGGLIEGAKRRIWSIARRIGEGRPRPDLRVALVGYRDLGDEYVTRVHDLSGDMDEVYQNLSAFNADGGGDTPEHVSRALHDAVHRISWSQGTGLRVIFLVGDAPPHVDYQGGDGRGRRHRHAAGRHHAQAGGTESDARGRSCRGRRLLRRRGTAGREGPRGPARRGAEEGSGVLAAGGGRAGRGQGQDRGRGGRLSPGAEGAARGIAGADPDAAEAARGVPARATGRPRGRLRREGRAEPARASRPAGNKVLG